MSYLYDCLIRYGDAYALKNRANPAEINKGLLPYSKKWVKYNPRKPIPREGLSITSLDGGLSGVPDLDSVREYNNKHKLNLDETDFNQKTELWPIIRNVLEPYENYLGRTHFIRMMQGGCFPPHRDLYSREVNSFRLFLPLVGCNPPDSYFILNNNILHFDHGSLYFLDTCKEHTVFTTGMFSLFVVANIIISEESVDTVLKNMRLS